MWLTGGGAAYPWTQSAALGGATNIAIQDVCPGRVVGHFETIYDAAFYAVIIDALTQQSQPGASMAHPVIAITPSAGFVGSNGLVLLSGNNTIRGLVIQSFAGNGLVVGSAASSPSLPGGNNLIVSSTPPPTRRWPVAPGTTTSPRGSKPSRV